MLTEALGHFFGTLGAEWVLWVLASLVALIAWVGIDRAVFHAKNGVDVDTLTAKMLEALRAGGAPAASQTVASTPGMAGSVLRQALAAHEDGVDSVEEVVQATIGRERLRYDRFTSILGTVANNAPFIGLFGTVIGILNAFGSLASALQGESRSELVMASISEALVATAVGLGVAIPAVILFNIFRGKTKRMSASVEAAARLVLAHLKSTAGHGGGR